MRVVLIVNPASGESMLAQNMGSTEQVEEAILTALRTHGIEPEVVHTTPEERGEEQARQAAKEGADIVIAAGGDGTIHAVASGLIGTKSTLGVIAMGTMNNIARSLDLPKTVEEMCEVIAKGTTSVVDVGRMNGHIFLEVTGIGLEAELFPAAENVKKSGVLSTVRGVFSGLRSLFSYKPPLFKVSLDGRKRYTYNAIQVTVCNTPYYGPDLQLVPNILMDDGLLDVIIYKNFSKLEYVRHGISITRGKRVLQPKIRRRKAHSIVITSDHPIEVHTDGIPQGTTPVKIEVEPGVLRVRIPDKVASGPNISQPRMRKRIGRSSTGTPRAKREGQLPQQETDEKKGVIHAR